MATNLRTAVLMSLLSFLTTGCSAGWKTIRQGTWNGTPYEVQERESSGAFASTNSLDWRIRLGRQKPVPINANTTDWGPPYSTDIYATDSYLYIDDQDTTYRNVPFTPGTTGVAHTMLYVSPSVLGEAEFEDFYHFMKAEWPALSRTFAGRDLRDFPHIIGLVYGRQEQFNQTFKGRHDGKAMVLRIDNDGRVRLANDDQWANENWSGLAFMVQMPGKRLLLDTTRANGGLTMDELDNFKDARGTSVTAHFDVQPSNWSAVTEQGRETQTLLTHKWQATPQQTTADSYLGTDGSYLWLRDGGIAEEQEGGQARPADWSYDALTRTVTVRTDSTRTVYDLRSVNETELVLEWHDPAAGAVSRVFRRAD